VVVRFFDSPLSGCIVGFDLQTVLSKCSSHSRADTSWFLEIYILLCVCYSLKSFSGWSCWCDRSLNRFLRLGHICLWLGYNLCGLILLIKDVLFVKDSVTEFILDYRSTEVSFYPILYQRKFQNLVYRRS
jgi:hypothetical protein